MKKIKRPVAFMLVISLLLLCTACSRGSEEILQDETTTEIAMQEVESESDFFGFDETETTTTTQKSLSELGFYDLNEMGDILIGINGYDFSGDDPYVYYESDYSSERIWKFKNDYIFSCKIDKNHELVSSEIIGEYTIVDNDTVYAYSSDEGNGTLILSGRKTFPKYNTVIFTLMNNGYEDCWLIPYSAIDWDRGFCEVEQDTSSYYVKTTYFKLYLKK